MKTTFLLLTLLVYSLTFSQNLTGAWQKVDNSKFKTIKLYSNHYFTSATYDESDGEFIEASAGTFTKNDFDYIENIETHSESTSLAGTYINFNYEIKNDTLKIKDKNSRHEETWVKIDEAKKEHVTCYRIHEVFRDSKWQTIGYKPRKTIKMLSDNYYQVIAINSQTGEFFGSSGGKWTSLDDKHQEHIKFFSKNQSMTGVTLEFRKNIEGDIWHHDGKSSKGEYIQERWIKYK
ncbi:hypothetical protein [Psychroflexus aestuariivivens]|uniref:hypothetical protein n=1 Tax=Psychroflexus aestuariivivens TaxID=1795040 RepID=UPI000FD87D65|nr:hypothetical protein [Psychroflexus aestuariivivens]